MSTVTEPRPRRVRQFDDSRDNACWTRAVGRIRDAMAARQMTQGDVATALGVTPVHVCNMLATGRDGRFDYSWPTLRMILRLAVLLDVEPSELIPTLDELPKLAEGE